MEAAEEADTAGAAALAPSAKEHKSVSMPPDDAMVGDLGGER